MPAAKKATTKTGVITAEFEQDRETKNAYRFAEVLEKGQDRGVIGSIYALKDALEKAGIDPDGPIKVTVEQADE